MKTKMPIFLINNNVSEKDLTIFQKNLISCAKNSKVKIIEEYISDKPSNNNVVNFLEIHEGAEVTHLIFQKNKEKVNLQSTSYTNCYNNSSYKQLTLNISSGSVRNHHYANLLGQNSLLLSLDGIFFASANQIIDNKTHVNHNYPNSTSRQRYKGILTDHARASYLSKTYVDQIAQKTEAYQLSKGILLSDNSSFHSKPELRIFADDVKCSHGSTIGPVDKDLLFYLRSRGLSKKNSLSLLIKSFFHKIISDVHDKSFVEKFNYHSNILVKRKQYLICLQILEINFQSYEKNPDLIFLDTAASALKPQNMIDAINNCYSYEYSNVHRGLYSLSSKLTKKFEDARVKVSNFISFIKS